MKTLSLLLVTLMLLACATLVCAKELAFERDDDDGRLEEEGELLPPIDIPKSLDPFFVQVDEEVRQLRLRFKLPRQEGKVVVSFKTTERVRPFSLSLSCCCRPRLCCRRCE